VVGSSAQGSSRFTPYIVIASLGVSIILFTFVLKVSTALITIPPFVWTSLSGGIVLLFGLTLLFPSLWEKVPGIANLSIGSNKVLGAGYTKKSFWGDVLIGASLGPVFSTCSPTYFVILATVLPASFILGSFYLLAYVLGLSIVLLLIALIGERMTARLGGLADSRGYFKKVIGLLFIVIGLLIVTGFEKKIETAILERGYFDVSKLEYQLLNTLEEETVTNTSGESKEEVRVEKEEVKQDVVPTSERTKESMKEPAVAVLVPSVPPAVVSKVVPTPKVAESTKQSYVEFVNPSGFVNTDGKEIKMSDFVGKQIILVEVMTYSCINCQRTFPYMNSWYKKYKDDGLTVIGLHTPEFAFEKKIENVEKAMEEFGIAFPVVLDNNYETWNAYGNRFWPRRYLIDLDGNIAFDHIGEGKYKETEEKIVELLEERKVKRGVE
jgi:cytochrome c biogenesis protein CcdA/peroxiredoxin